MKITLRNTKVKTERNAYEALEVESVQTNIYLVEQATCINYNANYKSYMFDISNVSKIKVSGATASSGQNGLIMKYLKSKNGTIPESKTWSSGTGIASWYPDNFKAYSNVVSSSYEGERIDQTPVEEYTIPNNGYDVLIVVADKTYPAPVVKALVE